MPSPKSPAVGPVPSVPRGESVDPPQETSARGAQVDPEHYASARYESRARFLSYYHQVSAVRALASDRVLEVGIGNGFVSTYLRRAGVTVHTVDFDPRLGPDTVASVTALPFPDRSHEVVCCFETLEHLPWREFQPALRELARVSLRHVLVSLPDVTPFFRLSLEAGYEPAGLRVAFDVPRLLPPVHRWNGEHYWEIGKRGYRLGRVRRAIEGAGLSVEAVSRDYDDPYHRFFRCTVRP